MRRIIRLPEAEGDGATERNEATAHDLGAPSVHPAPSMDPDATPEAEAGAARSSGISSIRRRLLGPAPRGTGPLGEVAQAIRDGARLQSRAVIGLASAILLSVLLASATVLILGFLWLARVEPPQGDKTEEGAIHGPVGAAGYGAPHATQTFVLGEAAPWDAHARSGADWTAPLARATREGSQAERRFHALAEFESIPEARSGNTPLHPGDAARGQRNEITGVNTWVARHTAGGNGLPGDVER